MASLIDVTNSAFRFTPYNWAISSGHARTINSGAGFRIYFTGTSAALNFDVSLNSGNLPQVYARIDAGPWVRYVLAATLTLSTTLDNRKHLLEFVVKSTSESSTRWTGGATMVNFTGLSLDDGASVAAPQRRTFSVAIFGDSITEGFKTAYSPTTSNDCDWSDVLACWSHALAESLDAEVGIIGFGGQGIAIGGVQGVPSLANAYNLIFSGVSRAFTPAPDLIIYLEGENDTHDVTTEYTAFLNTMVSLLPGTKHLVMRSLSGINGASASGAVAAVNNSKVIYVETSGWFNPTDSPDGQHPYGYTSVGDIAPKIIAVAQQTLWGSGTGEVSSGFAG